MTTSFSRRCRKTTASLFEHCARGLDQAIALTGANGMPLIGTGDWNDGMNRVGEGGQGTSVWLGWLLIATIGLMAPHGRHPRPGPGGALAGPCAMRSLQAIETRRLGRRMVSPRHLRRRHACWARPRSEECRIDSIAQSWAVLSGAADPARARHGDGLDDAST